MISTFLFILATLLLSLNFVRPFGLAISDWLYFGALSFAVFETLTIDRLNLICWIKNRFIVPAGLILFGAFISTFNSKFLDEAIFEIIQQIYVITLFISLIWIMVRRGKTNLMIQAFIFSGVFTAIVGIIENFSTVNFGPRFFGTPDIQYYGRVSGTLGHPNKFGYFLVITAILSLAKWIDLRSTRSIRSNNFARLFWILLILIQLYGVYLSSSLTAYLGLILGFGILYLFSLSFGIRKLFIIIFILIITLGIFIIMFAIINIDTSFLSFYFINGNSNLVLSTIARVVNITANSRIMIYEKAIAYIVNNPLIGVGYEQLSTSRLDPMFRDFQFDGIHNIFLQIWYVGGFFAFFGWILIYIILGLIAFRFLSIRHKVKISSTLLGIIAAVLAILLMDQFQDAIYQREKWLVFGLLASMAWERFIIQKFTKKI